MTSRVTSPKASTLPPSAFIWASAASRLAKAGRLGSFMGPRAFEPRTKKAFLASTQALVV